MTRIRALALIPALLAAFTPAAEGAPRKCFGEKATITGRRLIRN
ncbi:MAG TPA: hypothetical protein VEV43_10610 [Actinomycetota bacterium]|nr:hypothetical protein [Actinomycetota bacterium]